MPKKQQKKRKTTTSPDRKTFSGTLDITRSGMGYVIVDKESVDIMVKPNDFNTALHGDTVRVKIHGASGSSKRQQGEVVEVIKRRQIEFPGKLQLNKNFAFFVSDSDKPMPDTYVPLENILGATESDRVVVRLISWEKNKKPLGEVVQILNPDDESDYAMKEILMESGFPLKFPDDVLEDAARIP